MAPSFSFSGMKYNYLLAALLMGALSQQAQAQTTAWRPFRPGLVYHFQNAGSDSLFTLRVDSAYVAGSDSVYRFNRVLRRVSAGRYTKSSNNLFGNSLTVKNAPREFTLQMLAEAAITQSPGAPAVAAQTVNLRPQAPVGSSWPLSPTVTATLTARTLRTLDGTPDSVATITGSDGRLFEIGKQSGLITAPRGLGTAATARVMRLHKTPQPQVYYQQPKDIYDFQPGDELGYFSQSTQVAACSDMRRLLRIVSRQQTADSLIYHTQQQGMSVAYGPPYCPGPFQQTFQPAYQKRVAYALRPAKATTGDPLGLLTYEYTLGPTTIALMLPITRITTCNVTRYQISTTLLFYKGSPFLSPDPDFIVANKYSTGLGRTNAGYEDLIYYLKYAPTGGSTSCGTSSPFATLLPSRATEATAAATLHPNPASEAATLTLAAPTQPGTTLTLTDALGRRVWSAEVVSGQTVLPIPLTSQPAGLYLVQLLAPGAALLTWKLQH